MSFEPDLSRTRRDDRDRDPRTLFSLSGVSTVARVISSSPHLAVGKFLEAIPQAVLGDETEGATATFTDLGTDPILVDQVGPGVPATTDRIIAHRVPYRWISRKRGCTATIVASAKCGGSGSAISGYTFELRDAADTTTLQTLSGTTVTFTVAGGVGYKVRASKAGYHTQTSTTTTPACGATATVTVSTWPTTATLTVHAILTAPSCAHAGASVAVTGDATGSGTTNSSGDAAITISTSSSSVTQSLTITVTSPAGTGSTPASVGITFNACTGATQNVTVNHDGSHLGIVCGQRYLPTTLSYSDDYGTCTLTSSGSAYIGSYSYTSSAAIKRINCGGVDIRCVKDQTLSIPVSISLAPTGVCNGPATWYLTRSVYCGSAGSCASPGATACQVTDSDCASLFSGVGQTGSFDCSTTSLSWTGTLSAFPAFLLGCVGDVPETAQTSVSITGTI